MTRQISFPTGEVPRPSSHVRSFDNDSQQYIHYLANMIHTEPIVESLDGQQIATNDFKAFVNVEYGHFAKEAIRMFFTLGFVVWRIRNKRFRGKIEKTPEVLPLGTFTWTVRTSESKTKNKRKREDDPLLYYDVTLNGIDCEFHVLQVARACKMRSEEWNSSARVAVEHNEKMLVNQLADDGHVLQENNTMNSQFDALYEDGLGESTEARATVIREQANKAGFPSGSHTFVVPKNHSVRSLDTVEQPNGMPEAEMEFQRSVCYSVGVPCNLVIQNYTTSQNSSSSSGTSELTTQSTQMLQHTCTNVAKHVGALLNEVYNVSFVNDTDTAQQNGKQKQMVFEINCSPVMDLGDIVELHFRHLVDDKVISEMLLNTIGFPLNYIGSKRLPWNKTVQEPQKPEKKASSSSSKK
eukprot:3941918-Rhodomonas_salina.4